MLSFKGHTSDFVPFFEIEDAEFENGLDGLNWYVYVGNNPLVYVDPTGLAGEEAVNNSVQKGELLWQSVDRLNEQHGAEYSYDEVAEKSGFSKNSEGNWEYGVGAELKMDGRDTKGVNFDGLKQLTSNVVGAFVDGKIGSSYTGVIEAVFGLTNVQYHITAAGLNSEQLQKQIGNQPTMLAFSQNHFWGKKTDGSDRTGQHGVSYYKGVLYDPYIGRSGTYEQTRGSQGSASITDNLGGLYFTWDK